MRPIPRAASRGTIRASRFPGRSRARRSSRRRIVAGPRSSASSRSAEMRVALAGSTGLIGAALAARLAASGHQLVRLGRAASSDVRVDLAADEGIAPRALAGCDALVHAAGVTDEDFADPAAALAKSGRGARALLAAASPAGAGGSGGGPAGLTRANAPGEETLSVFDFASLCAKIAAEETGRQCPVERPEPQGTPPGRFEYRTLFGGPLPGPPLQDHVRALLRALRGSPK